ncbi:MAG: DegT/DnrJ/EryC1/StrS family aminotransferase [Candidatus Omnitrophica bacterium]|nr:DegT/DnrJ/EryC1/StrS family aminotransferase [Candidatus Omnitrophota bacterium]
MIRKIPITAAVLPLTQIIGSIRGLCSGEKAQEELKQNLAAVLKRRHIILSDSGLSAFYLILAALKKGSSRNEVILPAYTAGSLVVSVRKAGLKPVLCDISLNDFNMDAALLPGIISQNTLCIVGVHMFGIVMPGLGRLKKRFPGVFIIEDACQSFGSRMQGEMADAAADVSFFSFNRGKNLPTYGGGCIALNNTELAQKIIKEAMSAQETGLGDKIRIWMKMLAMSVVVNPRLYGAIYPMLCRFKEVSPPHDFSVKRYTDVQAQVALDLLRQADASAAKRVYNGMRLIAGLKDSDALIVPDIPAHTKPAFNRFPVVFKDADKRSRAEKALWRHGFETSRMYMRPLHMMFDLGYAKAGFPNAEYLAERLLTLPVHLLLTESDLKKIIDTIRES